MAWGKGHKKEAIRKFNEFLSKIVKTKQIKEIKYLKDEGFGKHYLVTIDDETKELRHIGDGWYYVTKLQNYIRVHPNLEEALNKSMKTE